MPNIVSQVYRAIFGVSIALVGMFASSLLTQPGWAASGEITPKGSNAYQMVTGVDSEEDRSHWDAKFNTSAYVYGTEPAAFVRDNVHQFKVGRALDIAMSEGRNAVFLAKKGFSVDGVDYSEVAIRKAKRLARSNHVSINTINADLNHYKIKPDSYELIVNIQFLLRSLVPQIKSGLKHGGIVVFENYTVDQLKNPDGQGIRRDYLLAKGELRDLFKDFQIVVYRETNDGKDAVASLIAMKP